MPERETWHISPHDDGGWKVKKAGGEQAASRHETKDEAVEAARVIAKKRSKGQIKIHRQDGTIQEERTYGDDPSTSPG